MKICIALGSLVKSGAERGISDVARVLSTKHDISLVAYQHKDARAESWADFSIRLVEFKFGVLNYFVFGPLRLFSTLRQIDPDVCIQCAVGDLTGLIGAYSRLHNSRFIYHSANNMDLILRSAYWVTKSPISLFQYAFGLASADLVVAQTREIAEQFRNKFLGLKRVAYVPPIYDASSVRAPVSKSNYALWLARMVWFKQPELFIRLARSLPRYSFVMAGGGPMESEMRRLSGALPNLRFLGQVEHETAEQLCAKARVFVNTSTFEGFPLTFLEAAARRTPQVNLNYDPDEVICRYRLGFHSRSFEKLVKDVSSIMEDDHLTRELGDNARRYVIKKHSPEAALEAYESALSKLPIKRHPS